jgi:putative ABC transport system permease protein
MGIIQRGFRNAFRNVVRTTSIVLILGLSIGLAVIMLVSRQAVVAKIDSVKSSIGNIISVSPAGVRGFEGGGTLLTAENITSIQAMEHVKYVTSNLSARLTNGTNTSLVASLEAGNFGGGNRRPPGSENSSSNNIASGTTVQTFTMPINLTGTSDAANLQSLGVSSLTFSSGNNIDGSSDSNVAIVGTDLATKNNLSLGSNFTAYNTTITVSGIYDSGNKFTNSSVIMPLATVQRITSQIGGVSSAIVQTDSVDNLTTVQKDITTKLEDTVDVTSSEESAQTTITPLENVKSISGISLMGSIVAGAVIILLTMMMIVRERRREIGILKAIGATNLVVTAQFIIESVTLTLMGTMIGVMIGFVGSNPMIKLLVQNSSTTTTSRPGANGGPGMGGQMMQFAGQGLQSVRDIQATVGWELLLYGLGAAVAIAIIGSAVPAFIISKIRPAEVMRAE